MCADTRLATIRVDRENVGRTPEGTDHHPATIVAETDVLNLGGRKETKTAKVTRVYLRGGMEWKYQYGKFIQYLLITRTSCGDLTKPGVEGSIPCSLT